VRAIHVPAFLTAALTRLLDGIRIRPCFPVPAAATNDAPT
jgi:hypothetical protein